MNVREELDHLDAGLKQLRVAYEKYFAGVERIEPLKARDAYKKRLRRLNTQTINNTALRFRMQTIQASLITHEQYWNRVARQIEEGTFYRDRWRANRRNGERASLEAPADAANSDTPAHAATAIPESIRKLHATYLAARRKAGDSRDVSLEQLAKKVQSQYHAIRQQYQCSTVEFKVVLKEGRPILKGIPK